MIHTIKLSASKVASYIGLNRFEPIEKAVADLLGPKFSSNIEKQLTNATKDEIKELTAKLGLDKDTKKEIVIKKVEEKLKEASKDSITEKESKDNTKKIIKQLGLKGDTKKAVESDVSMTRGKNLEQKDINKIQETKGTNISKRNDNFYTLELELGEYDNTPYKCIIIGKIDGFEEETSRLIESKHRRSRLFKYVPVYEKIQCEIYMRMIDVDECLHCENYNEQLIETLLKKDETLWDTINSGLKDKFIPLYCSYSNKNKNECEID